MQYDLSLLERLAELTGEDYKRFDIWQVIRILEYYNSDECYYGEDDLESALFDYFGDMRWWCDHNCHQCEYYDKGNCKAPKSK